MKIKYIHQSDPDKEKVMDSEVLRKADLDFARGLNGFREADIPDQEEYDRRLLKKLICEAADKKIIRFEILEDESVPDSDDEPHEWMLEEKD